MRKCILQWFELAWLMLLSIFSCANLSFMCLLVGSVGPSLLSVFFLSFTYIFSIQVYYFLFFFLYCVYNFYEWHLYEEQFLILRKSSFIISKHFWSPYLAWSAVIMEVVSCGSFSKLYDCWLDRWAMSNGCFWEYPRDWEYSVKIKVPIFSSSIYLTLLMD